MKYTKKEIREAALASGTSDRRADAIVAILIENRKNREVKKAASKTNLFDMRPRFSAAKAAQERLPVYDVTINGHRGLVTDCIVGQSMWLSNRYTLIMDGRLANYDSEADVRLHSVI